MVGNRAEPGVSSLLLLIGSRTERLMGGYLLGRGVPASTSTLSAGRSSHAARRFCLSSQRQRSEKRSEVMRVEGHLDSCPRDFSSESFYFYFGKGEKSSLLFCNRRLARITVGISSRRGSWVFLS